MPRFSQITVGGYGPLGVTRCKVISGSIPSEGPRELVSSYRISRSIRRSLPIIAVWSSFSSNHIYGHPVVRPSSKPSRLKIFSWGCNSTATPSATQQGRLAQNGLYMTVVPLRSLHHATWHIGLWKSSAESRAPRMVCVRRYKLGKLEITEAAS